MQWHKSLTCRYPHRQCSECRKITHFSATRKKHRHISRNGSAEICSASGFFCSACRKFCSACRISYNASGFFAKAGTTKKAMLETSFISTVSQDYRRNQNSFNTRKRCSGALQETEIHQSILCLLASYFLNNP